MTKEGTTRTRRHDESSRPSVTWYSPRPSGWLLPISALTVILVLAWAGGPLSDPDIWWHVGTGELILDSGRVPHTDPWSFTTSAQSWVPTAWLSDVLFAGVWRLGGDESLRILRVALAGAVIVTTWTVARRYADTSAAAVTTALSTVSLAPFLRERPQVVSLLLVAWLAVLIQGALAGERPPLVLTVLVTYVWACIHGMWVLLPLGLLGASVLSYLDDRSRVALVARCTTVALLGTVITALTPAGPRLTLWPLVVHRAAAPISEWQPTVPTRPVAWAFGAMLCVVAGRWVAAPHRPPRRHVLYVGSLVAFALLASRNLAPATLLLVPEVARALSGSIPSRAHVSKPILLTVLVTGLALAGVRMTTTSTLAASQPTEIVAELSRRPGEVRVLNHYNVGGLLTGRASPPVRVAIDGRTDMWPPDYVRDYIEALNSQRDWRPLLDQLQPDAAVLLTDSEITRALVAERGWVTTLTDGRWALLEPGPAR